MRVCPYCNFKMLSDSPRCSRCGEKLIADRKDGGKPVVPYKKAEIEEAAPPPPPPINVTKTPKKPPPVVYTPPDPLAPLQSHGKPAPLSPPICPCPLPPRLAGYNPPIVEGEVVDTEQQASEDKSAKTGDVVRNVLGAAILPFNPVSGLLVLSGGLGKPKAYRSVYVFRLRTSTNKVVQVRIQKDIKTGSLRMGDYISVWGKNDGGEIVMSLGFNHTTEAEIRLV